MTKDDYTLIKQQIEADFRDKMAALDTLAQHFFPGIANGEPPPKRKYTRKKKDAVPTAADAEKVEENP